MCPGDLNNQYIGETKRLLFVRYKELVTQLIVWYLNISKIVFIKIFQENFFCCFSSYNVKFYFF